MSTYWSSNPLGHRILLVASMLFCPAGVECTPSPQTPSSLEIIFLDVGQGDAAIIRTPEGKVALIDAGPSPEIVAQLSEYGITSLDLVIATHPHSDHIGGMAAVLRSMPVTYYMDNGVPHATATYRTLLQELQASDVIYLQATPRSIQLGSVQIRILPPPPGDPSDQNNSSVGVLVEYGDFRAFFPGDAGVPELQHFLLTGVPQITVLKVPHHGSEGAVLPSFIAALSPEVAVISCGVGNSFGHPSPMTLSAYLNSGAQLFRTDLDGEVRIWGTPDGGFEIWTGRLGKGTSG